MRMIFAKALPGCDHSLNNGDMSAVSSGGNCLACGKFHHVLVFALLVSASTAGNMVARGRMDSLRSPCGCTSCVCRRYAPRLNCRHADFQSRVGSSEALYFNKLPRHPLLNLQYSAGLCTTHSRKTHARVLDKNTYTYHYLQVYLSND